MDCSFYYSATATYRCFKVIKKKQQLGLFVSYCFDRSESVTLNKLKIAAASCRSTFAEKAHTADAKHIVDQRLFRLKLLLDYHKDRNTAD